MTVSAYFPRLLVCMLLFALAGCMATDNPVPTDKIAELKGAWQQQNGARSIVRFYADETVKLSMPDEHPPVRLLSQMEVIKDEQIGFGVGDRWNGPVHVVISKDKNTLQLIFPGNTVRTLNFQRMK